MKPGRRIVIYDAIICGEQGGDATVCESRSFSGSVFRFVAGTVPMFGGSLVTYTFLSGGGPTPIGNLGQRIVGGVVIAAFFFALGILPLCWGLSLWFVRRSYTLRPATGALETHVAFAGLRLWTSRYVLAAFDQVAVRHELHGVFGKSLHFIVACDGRQKYDLSSYVHRTTADTFAAAIGAKLNLPVVTLPHDVDVTRHLEIHSQPQPVWSIATVAAVILTPTFAAIGHEVAGTGGAMKGSLVGIGIAIVVALYWGNRPRTPH